MRNLGKIVLHIPAREGSKRVPRKNFRLMNNKPMISYTIDASIKANITKEMYVNTDDTEIIDYVIKTYTDFKIYKRDKKLAEDKATSEDFNYDIMKKLQADTLIMINPVCPLVTTEDIINTFETYKNSTCDTLITSSSTQMQTFCDGKAINIKINEPLAPSQDNEKISILNWAITIWDAKKFMKRIENKGYGSLGENRILFDINPLHAIKVSEEKDFLLAEKLLQIKV
ncbi:MAG: acylneuraminate cytidylyltransferase [Arcobacter sp.]|nr:MAG: acylneuraminate cytidylyltransferase [Arcobacter sp.]